MTNTHFHKDFNTWAAAQARADAAYAAAPEGQKYAAYRAQIEREKAAVGHEPAAQIVIHLKFPSDSALGIMLRREAEHTGRSVDDIATDALVDRYADALLRASGVEVIDKADVLCGYHVTDAGRAAVTRNDIDYDDIAEKERDRRDEIEQVRRPL
jgi:hypothetical protein